VWKPALEAGFDYSAFSWSGLNRHRDRVRGARRLSSSVNEFAKRVQTTADDPLIVNFVAHSHGGNVVLEALRHLGANVRVGRVSLLGTPLVTVRPAFRIAQFVFLTIILAFLFVLIIVVISALATFLFTGHWFKAEQFVTVGGEVEPETELNASLLLWFPLVVIAYAWVFWVLGNFLDVAWRILCRVGLPIASMRKKARALVYGPSPRKLATILTGRPILLITSYNDEAGLLLQVGSAPARLYCEYLSTKFSIPMRVLEFAFIRPFTLVFLKATEMFLEVLSLGFSVRRALVQDFDIATRTRPVYYPADLLVQEQLDLRPQAVARSADVADATGHSDEPEGDLRFNISLESSLQEVTAELKRQIRLRHSMYYEDDTIIVKVADFLIGAEPRGTAATTATLSAKRPLPEFWEGLLVANLGLALLCWWILGPTRSTVRRRWLPLGLVTSFRSPFWV
jgi:hypothetical protein